MTAPVLLIYFQQYFRLILPSSGLLCRVGWFSTDVSGQPIGPVFKVVPKRRSLTCQPCVITQKTEEFRQTAPEVYDVATLPFRKKIKLKYKDYHLNNLNNMHKFYFTEFFYEYIRLEKVFNLMSLFAVQLLPASLFEV